jgi:hypothetical protein
MMVNPKVQSLFSKGLEAAMPQPSDTGADTGEDGETPPANPPQRRAGKRS